MIQTTPGIGQELPPIETLGVIVNAILSAILVILYYKVQQTQKKQAETLSKQEDLMAAEYQAAVFAEGYGADDDQLNVRISNFGKGVASELDLVTDLEFDSDQFEKQLLTSPLRKRDPDDNIRINAIPSGAENEEFSALSVIRLKNHSGDYEELKFSTAMEELSATDSDVESIEVSLYLTANDLTNDPVTRLLYNKKEVEPEEGLTLQRVIED